MNMSTPTRIEGGRAVLRRRSLQAVLRAPRAVAARLPRLSDGDGTKASRVAKGMAGVAVGTAAILTIKVAMLWAALQTI